MKGSLKLKVFVSLVTLVMMAGAIAMPFVGSMKQTHAAANSPLDSTPTYVPAQWTVQEGILYATLPFGSYRMNIYTLNPPPTGITPIVLYFYGCCNPNTTRDNALRLGKTPADPHEYLFRELLTNGYRVATLDYPSEYPVVNPHDVEAGKAAVRFLRANAATYNIDPTRIIAWGSSGGGNPVELMGTADKSAGWDIGQHLKYSSRVEAVLDWYGDQTNFSYVTSDDSPCLIQQGSRDAGFLKADSQNLYNALVAANVYAQLQWVANAGHKFVPSPAGSTTNPTYEGIAQTAVSFLNAKVRDNPNPLPQ
jgi:Dienelactone hydrolase family